MLKKHYKIETHPLKDWMDLANLLPADANLPKASALGTPCGRDWRRFERVYKEFVAKYGFPAQPLASLGDTAIVYLFVYLARQSLDVVVRALESQQLGPENPILALRDLPVGGMLFLSPDGKLKLRINPVVEELQRVDLSVLKRCPICRKLFLQKRKDQKACSRDCANTFRVRQHRAHRAKYERNRRQYRKQGFKARERTMLSAALRAAESEARKEKRR